MLSRILWKGYIAARGMRKTWREIDDLQQADGTRARQILAGKLMAQIQYFGNRKDSIPEWREAARIQDPLELWKLWPALPILTKSCLRGDFNPARLHEIGVDGAPSSTGGSTGEPTPYLHDHAMLLACAASRAYARISMGWVPGMPTITVWGSERDIGHQRRLGNRVSTRFRNETLVAGYSLDSRTVDVVRRFACTHRKFAITGFTSMLDFVARRLEAEAFSLPHGNDCVAWNGGEMLFEQQADRFLRVFGTPLLNCYGGREFSAIAFQRNKDSSLSIVRPLLFVEILRFDGTPALPGETGRVVVTSLVCRGTPFLRYDIGDLAEYLATDLDESGIRSISSLQGRSAGLLQLQNGKTINCLFWNHLFKEYGEIEQFQVASSGSALELRFKGKQMSHSRESELIRTIIRLTGTVSLSVRWMSSIPLTRQGKLEQVVRQ